MREGESAQDIHSSRHALRLRFDEDAERYDRARPRYPNELFEDLVQLANLHAGARVLEIGCGTGQATLPLAERGFSIVAVELGPSMADVARRNLACFPNVQVVTAAFEEWPLPAEPFALVLSATAFHWIDPTVRLRKTAEALRPGGALAIIATHHIGGGTPGFFDDAQRCYERWDPNTPPDLKMPTADDIPTADDELDRSEYYQSSMLRRYEWDETYSSTTYLDLLQTYSDQRARPAESGARLLECLRDLIDNHYGGSIRKRYLNELRLARKPK